MRPLSGSSLIARSSIYRTAPIGYADQPDFFNGVAELMTRLGPEQLEIGYWIHRDFTNQGLVTEATAALIKVAVEIMRVHRLEVHCDPRNVASAAIPRKLGFTHEGTLRAKTRFLDRWSDSMVWALRPQLQRAGTALPGSIEIRAIKPDGAVEPLLWINDHRPEWQLPYVLREPMRLPRGTRIVLTAHGEHVVRRGPDEDPDENTTISENVLGPTGFWDEPLAGHGSEASQTHIVIQTGLGIVFALLNDLFWAPRLFVERRRRDRAAGCRLSGRPLQRVDVQLNQQPVAECQLVPTLRVGGGQAEPEVGRGRGFPSIDLVLLVDRREEIREAADGQMGLTLYREAPTDLVITDILMPERDGMEVTLALTQEFLDARVIAMTGAAGLAAINAIGARAYADDAIVLRELKGNIRHAVARWTFDFLSLEELCRLAKRLGISAIDLVRPEEWPVLKRHGLDASMCNGAELSLEDGWGDARFHSALVERYLDHIDRVSEAGYTNLICFSGNARGMDPEEGLDNAEAGLKRILGRAEEKGVVLQMELLNSKIDHPDYLCDNSAWGIALCRRLDSPNFKLLYDIYHMQISEGDIIRTIRDNHRYFGHYHTAGVPGRHEIDDSQELNYPAICRAIRDTGFQGYVAQEFLPDREDDNEKFESLRAAIHLCDV